MFVPFRITEPAVGSINLASKRASVDLPQPDSPTTANVVARRSEKETPSTA
ncbi:unannotated protein [freshwater metagenome]|uniref:Unannotated protein n=1 Tax=freshwater metagenome TaxID=449393 RepID=A0A6J6IUH8_9ZZZZ